MENIEEGSRLFIRNGPMEQTAEKRIQVYFKKSCRDESGVYQVSRNGVTISHGPTVLVLTYKKGQIEDFLNTFDRLSQISYIVVDGKMYYDARV